MDEPVKNDEKITFREAALTELTSPDQLDQLINIVPVKAWVIASVLYCLLFFLIIWSIFGSVETRAEGAGILLAGNGDIYSAVAPLGPSRIQKILVVAGQQVKQGQVLAVLARPDLLDQINVSQKYIAQLNQQYQQLKTSAAQQIAKRQQQTIVQQQALQQSLNNSQNKLKNLDDLLAIKQNAFKRGIETRQSVDQTYQDDFNVKSEIQGYNNQLVQLKVQQDAFADQWNERLRELNLKITDENAKLSNMQTELKRSASVTSPVDGTVIGIQAIVGTIINTGASVVAIADHGKGLDALIYLPPQVGKQVKYDMKALVTPTTVEKAEYGSIYGKVLSVAAFPATPEAIEASLQNQNLVRQFSGSGAPIEIRVHLENDPTTYSGLDWSSSKGPQQLITPGTLATATITIRKQPPITLVIPAFKKMMGL